MQILLADVSTLEYLPIFVFLMIAVLLSVIIMIMPKILATNKPQKAKLAPYECGFAPFEDARIKFDIQFYLVAILFIIFDLEIIFLIPWAISLKHIGLTGFISMMFFLFILTVGFIYEWRKGALDWR